MMTLDKSSKEKYFEWLFKYLWIVLIMPKSIQLAILGMYALFLFYINDHKVKIDLFAGCMGAYIIVHIISVLVHIPQVKAMERIFAAGNTVAIGCVAILLYTLYSAVKIDIAKIAKYCFIDLAILLLLAVFFKLFVIAGMDEFNIPILNRSLIMIEELNDNPFNARFIGFLDYPTLVVAVVLLLFPFAFTYEYNKLTPVTGKIKVRLIIFMSYLLMGIPIYYCYSRIGYVLYFMGFIGIVIVLLREDLTKEQFKIFTICASIAAVILCFLLREKIYGVLMHLWKFREGSNDDRKKIYTQSLEEWRKSPVIGKGIKVIGRADYPLGSHSTYIGFLYKTGILGTIFALTAFFTQIKESVKNLFKGNLCRQIVAGFLILFFMFLVFEDVDGADWLICLFFSILGISANAFEDSNEISQ